MLWGSPNCLPFSNNIQHLRSTIIHFRVSFPKAVCHLPISAQLEYRRLINRMKLLEKQKEQKSSQIKQLKSPQNSSTSDPPFANIRVTLKNENRFIETNDVKPKQHDERMTSPSSPPPSTSSSAKLKDSLKKKVLLKNTLNAAAAASTVSNEPNAISSQSHAVRHPNSSKPSKTETSSSEVQADVNNDAPTLSELEVATLRKTESKVNAHR